LEIMEEFDFQVEHRPGTKHGNADAVSRSPCYVKSCACRQSEDARDDSGSQTVNSTSVESEGNAFFSLPVSTSDSADGKKTTDEYWSTDGLRSAQENDPDISGIL